MKKRVEVGPEMRWNRCEQFRRIALGEINGADGWQHAWITATVDHERHDPLRHRDTPIARALRTSVLPRRAHFRRDGSGAHFKSLTLASQLSSASHKTVTK